MAALDRRNMETRFLQFIVAGGMHLGFFKPLLDHPRLDREPFCVPWYLDRFALRSDHLTNPDYKEPLAALTDFFSARHLPWWRQMLALEPERVRLLNREALVADGNQARVDLYKLGLLAFPAKIDERPTGTLDYVDRFFSDMVAVAKSAPGEKGAPSYMSLLTHAAERFVEREYQRKIR